jgi:hypothetical protein
MRTVPPSHQANARQCRITVPNLMLLGARLQGGATGYCRRLPTRHGGRGATYCRRIHTVRCDQRRYGWPCNNALNSTGQTLQQTATSRFTDPRISKCKKPHSSSAAPRKRRLRSRRAGDVDLADPDVRVRRVRSSEFAPQVNRRSRSLAKPVEYGIECKDQRALTSSRCSEDQIQPAFGFLFPCRSHRANR